MGTKYAPQPAQHAAQAHPASQPAVRPEDSTRSAKLLANARRPFLAGTEIAHALAEFVTHTLKAKTKDSWIIDMPGHKGILARRVDSHGLAVFAFYERSNPKARFKRDREKYPAPPRARFYTLPALYALLTEGRIISAKETGEWSRRLLREFSESDACAVVSPPWLRDLEELQDPDATDDWGDMMWRLRFGHLRGSKQFVRADRRQERLVHAIAKHVFLPRWREGYLRTGRLTLVEASDGFVADALIRTGRFHSDTARDLECRVRLAMGLLEQSGMVRAVALVGSKKNRNAHFAYLPGSGQLAKGRRRSMEVTARDAVQAARQLVQA